MALVYHFHGDVGENGTLDCGLINGHDPSCTSGIFNNANEDLCEKRTGKPPKGKEHKCIHKVADEEAEGYPLRE